MDVTATRQAVSRAAVHDEMDKSCLLALSEDETAVNWPDCLICEHNYHWQQVDQRAIIRERYRYAAALNDGDEPYDLRQDASEPVHLIHPSSPGDSAEELRASIFEHTGRIQGRVVECPAFRRDAASESAALVAPRPT